MTIERPLAICASISLRLKTLDFLSARAAMLWCGVVHEVCTNGCPSAGSIDERNSMYRQSDHSFAASQKELDVAVSCAGASQWNRRA